VKKKNATDWNSAAERIGNAILSRVNNWLIFVEGNAGSPPCEKACFYGENLKGVKSNPVRLNVPNMLVYSPHSYGPQVYPQPYFNDANFPDNMPAIWDDHFGYIKDMKGPAVVTGEWGGNLQGKNGVWMNAFVNYLKNRKMTDTFFWCLNPDSGDTGGLLDYDWVTPVQDKLDLLAKLVPNPSPVK